MCCFSDFLLWFAISQIFPHFPALRLGTAKIGKNRQTEKLSPKKGPPSAMNGRQLRQLFRTKTTSVQMLDAAHGQSRRPVRIAQGDNAHIGEIHVASIEIASGIARRTPIVTARTDDAQGSRRAVAVARSRPGIREQSLEGMRRRVRNKVFCYNCRCIAALLSRAGRSLAPRRPANIRLSPGVPRRLRPPHLDNPTLSS